MTFKEAMNMTKNGHKTTREIWNRKYYLEFDESYHMITIVECNILGEREKSYIYVPKVSDISARDWRPLFAG